MVELITDRFIRRALIVVALAGLVLGILAWVAGHDMLAGWVWAAGTVPVVVGLAVSIVRDLMAGRMGVDAVAFVSMSAALLLGENLAGAVVAVMYAGGNAARGFCRCARRARSQTPCRSRASGGSPANRASVEDVPIDQVAVGDALIVRAGEVVPVDGVIIADKGCHARRGGSDRRAHTRDPQPGRPGSQRDDQCRGDICVACDRDRRRKYLRRDRAHGDRGADREGSVHPPRGPLRFAAAARNAGACRGGLAVLRATRYADSPFWFPRPRAR